MEEEPSAPGKRLPSVSHVPEATLGDPAPNKSQLTKCTRELSSDQLNRPRSEECPKRPTQSPNIMNILSH